MPLNMFGSIMSSGRFSGCVYRFVDLKIHIVSRCETVTSCEDSLIVSVHIVRSSTRWLAQKYASAGYRPR